MKIVEEIDSYNTDSSCLFLYILGRFQQKDSFIQIFVDDGKCLYLLTRDHQRKSKRWYSGPFLNRANPTYTQFRKDSFKQFVCLDGIASLERNKGRGTETYIDSILESHL